MVIFYYFLFSFIIIFLLLLLILLLFLNSVHNWQLRLFWDNKKKCNTAHEGIFTINGGNFEIVGFVPNVNEAMLACVEFEL